MAGPRRVLIDWDYCAPGIWWILTRLGTDGWEVLYRLGDRMIRVHPPGSWPAGTWQQELLGYAPRDQHDASPGRG